MELVELIRGAQDAMDRGNYAHTASACTHALDTYPSCFAAHRMLAEAYLEQGRTDAAIEHFGRALAIDPLNVVARLGLGVASEEKRDVNTAYSAYLHAWESNPALDQVRDELVRLRGLLGGDERLHPTRAGLAGVYARGGQFGRAAAEWRAVLMTEPDNGRARTALSEILWRSGDDLAASASCREALSDAPENARALALLAEIEQRRGSIAASELIDRYHAVDPLGEIVTLMTEWRDGADLDSLRLESASVPDFDPTAVAAFDHFESVPTDSGPAPKAPGLAGGHFAAPDLWDTIVKDLGTETLNFNEPPTLDDGVQPFSWQDESGSNGLPTLEPFSLDTLQPTQDAFPADLQDALPPLPIAPVQELQSLDDAIASLDAEPAAAPEPALIGSSLEVDDGAPVAGLVAAGALIGAAASSNDNFVTSDGRVDLTVGWDDLDRQLREATPTFDDTAEIDELAASLGVDGILPFDAGENPFDAAAWDPFTDDEVGANVAPAPAVPMAAAPVQPDPVAPGPDSALMGWDLDDELVSAIPSQQPTGYTEMLRHVDTELPIDVDRDGSVNPFANPDVAGDPLAFEDLLAVTSRDGTAPLAAPPELSSSALPANSDPAPFDAGMLEALDRQQPSDAPAWFVDAAPEQDSEAELQEIPAVDLPLDENPFGLEELLRSDAAAETDGAEAGQPWQTPGVVPADLEFDATPAAPRSPDLAALAIAATLADLGDVLPFSIDEADAEVPVQSEVVDFSDINEAPFDPQALSGLIEPTAQPAGLPEWAADADQVAASLIAETRTDVSLQSEAADAFVVAEPDVVPVAAQVAIDAPRSDNGTADAPSGVAWPAFVNHTSELIDRGVGGNLFGRLRDSKRSAVSAGLLTVDRSFAVLRHGIEPAATATEMVQVISVPANNTATAGGAGTNGLTDEERVDLMTMRVRLIEDAESAEEVARTLEVATARGMMNDPLALRVLGEAYLKLGRTEQAAAQFRQAMLARRRSR